MVLIVQSDGAPVARRAPIAVKGGRSCPPSRRRFGVAIKLADQPSKRQSTVTIDGNSRVRTRPRRHGQPFLCNCLARLLAAIPSLPGKLQEAQVMRFKIVRRGDAREPLAGLGG